MCSIYISVIVGLKGNVDLDHVVKFFVQNKNSNQLNSTFSFTFGSDGPTSTTLDEGFKACKCLAAEDPIIPAPTTQ